MNAAHKPNSLLEGRNNAPLSEKEIKRASNTFIGFDQNVNVRYEPGAHTRFRVSEDEAGEEYGEIIFSEDIYPGNNVANPNSALSVPGAAAHELAHFYRWQGKTELPDGQLTHIDEAMTSLEAALRYSHGLSTTDLHGLISDALQRLRLFVGEQAA
jgi:hypothetical protein